jgi:hypothetical protein
MMSESNIQCNIKKIKVIKSKNPPINSTIKPKIVKLKKKTNTEIQNITEMFSQLTINNPPNNSPKNIPSPSKKRHSPTQSEPLVDTSIEYISNKLSKLSIDAFNIPLLPINDVFTKPHFTIIPIYVDLNTIKSNYNKNLINSNPSTLYMLYTRFLLEPPFSLDITLEPDESIDISIYLQDKYGIDEDNVYLISEISLIPNLKIYSVYLKKFIVVPTVYTWKSCLDLYNHIKVPDDYDLDNVYKSKHDYDLDNVYKSKHRRIEYSYEVNPYKAILNNAGPNLLERNLGNIIRLAHIYQNIMENFETLLQNQL